MRASVRFFLSVAMLSACVPPTIKGAKLVHGVYLKPLDGFRAAKVAMDFRLIGYRLFRYTT